MSLTSYPPTLKLLLDSVCVSVIGHACVHAMCDSLESNVFITAEVRMMTSVIKIRSHRKMLIKRLPVAACTQYVKCVTYLCVISVRVFFCHVASGWMFPLKDRILCVLFLKFPKIYRTGKCAIFVWWVQLLIGVASGFPRAIGKCAWMCMCNCVILPVWVSQPMIPTHERHEVWS